MIGHEPGLSSRLPLLAFAGTVGLYIMIVPVARTRIELQDLEPKIWRRIDVPLSTTLAALHDIIQVAFRWTDSHLHEFESDGRAYGVPCRTRTITGASSTRRRAFA